MNTQSRHRISLPSGATLVVNRVASEPTVVYAAYRGFSRIYSYTIRDPNGEIVVRGRDLYGPPGRHRLAEAPTAAEMTGVLLGGLAQAGDRYHFQVVDGQAPTSEAERRRRGGTVFVPRYTLEGDRWASQNRREIAATLRDWVRDEQESSPSRASKRAPQPEADGPPSPCPPAARGSQLGPGM